MAAVWNDIAAIAALEVNVEPAAIEVTRTDPALERRFLKAPLECVRTARPKLAAARQPDK